MNKAKPEDVNMQLIGFKVTRIFTNYAQKLPGPLLTAQDPHERTNTSY